MQDNGGHFHAGRNHSKGKLQAVKVKDGLKLNSCNFGDDFQAVLLDFLLLRTDEELHRYDNAFQ